MFAWTRFRGGADVADWIGLGPTNLFFALKMCTGSREEIIHFIHLALKMCVNLTPVPALWSASLNLDKISSAQLLHNFFFFFLVDRNY